jgi:hypothetical protein
MGVLVVETIWKLLPTKIDLPLDDRREFLYGKRESIGNYV